MSTSEKIVAIPNPLVSAHFLSFTLKKQISLFLYFYYCTDCTYNPFNVWI